jgi:hypothetical protein
MNGKMMNESENVEREIKKLIKKAQMEVLEVCAKEYNFDIKAAMLLIGAGGLRKDAKELKEKKERAKKVVVEGERKSKGRPKNPEKVVEVEETDNLFERLVKMHIETEEVASHSSVEFQTKDEKKEKKIAEKEERSMMSGAEKEIKQVNKLEAKLASANAAKEEAKLAKIEANAAKEQAKEQAKEEAKLAKEEATASANAAKEQAKLEAKLAKEEATASANAAKEQAKLAKEEAKEAEKGAKLAKKTKKTDTDTSSKSLKKATLKKTVESSISAIVKDTNDVEYQAKMTVLSEKLEAAPGHKMVMPVEVVASSKEPIAAAVPATLKVKSFKYEGATYFREKNTGAIYDKETNDHLGQWNEATQKIDFLEAEEELEEEEESDGESSDEEEEESA